MSQEQKENLTWIKMCFSSFLKGFHFSKLKTNFLEGESLITNTNRWPIQDNKQLKISSNLITLIDID